MTNPPTLWCEGMSARVHRAAWSDDHYAGGTFHLLHLLGSRPALTAISAALLKKNASRAELGQPSDSGATAHIATVRRQSNNDHDPISYRRIIEATTYPGVAQAIIWSSQCEDHNTTPIAVAIGRTQAELRESFYRRVNRRTIVPMVEDWTRWLLSRMVEDQHATRLTCIDCHAVRIHTVSNDYITQQIAEHIEGAPA